MSPRLVVFGLGNPGPRYADTRHNVGFRVADRLAAGHGVARWKRSRSYVAAWIEFDSAHVGLVKPQTFMNLSGAAVRDWCEEHGVPAEGLLVVVDDIALPFGQLRLRRQGSDGGHNGVKSIISALGTTGFPRLRLGIGLVPAGVDPAEFVLTPFSTEEKPVVDAMVGRAARCVEAVAREGLEPAMNAFNVSIGDSREEGGAGTQGKGDIRETG